MRPITTTPHSAPIRITRARLLIIFLTILLSLSALSYTFSFSPRYTTFKDNLGDVYSKWSWSSVSYKDETKLEYIKGIARVKSLGTVHPVEKLIELGQAKAEEQERKLGRVQDLGDAVRDYKLEFGMDPPEGFDAWYKLAVDSSSVPVASLYPLAHRSVLPFLSLPPATLRDRAREVIKQKATFGIELHPEIANVTLLEVDGLTRLKTLHEEWVDLILPAMHLFPGSQDEGEAVMLPIWVDDVSHHPPSAVILSRSRELAQAGEVWDMDELSALEAREEQKYGWGNACDPPIFPSDAYHSLRTTHAENAKSVGLVYDPLEYADPCLHPEHLVQNGEMIMKEDWLVRGLIPMASLNTPVGGGEIIGPTSVGTDRLYNTIPWQDRIDSRLFWRGNPNSAFIFDAWKWRAGQRFRLADFVSLRLQNQEGEGGAGQHADVQGDEAMALWQPDEVVVLGRKVDVSTTSGGDKGSASGSGGSHRVAGGNWQVKRLPRREGVQGMLNVSLTDYNPRWPCGEHAAPEYFCFLENGTRRPDCPMEKEKCLEKLGEYDMVGLSIGDKASEQFKFRLDIDGFGWTTRWRSELSRGSVMLKATLYPEWWSAQAIPWYHYIPARYDFLDLFTILGYFTGAFDDLNGGASSSDQEVAQDDVEMLKAEIKRRDEMAEKIAQRGRDFALNRMREEDMRVYWFLVLLEYRRAWSDDRTAAAYRAP